MKSLNRMNYKELRTELKATLEKLQKAESKVREYKTLISKENYISGCSVGKALNKEEVDKLKARNIQLLSDSQRLKGQVQVCKDLINGIQLNHYKWLMIMFGLGACSAGVGAFMVKALGVA